MNVLDRFLTYVAYWTTSDDASLESPSTARQKTLGHLLVDEMQALGLQDVTMDAAGNVIGTLPATCASAPVLALIAHMDTSPDAPGKDVHPRIVPCTGQPLTLCDGVTLSQTNCPGWQDLAGQDLIVTDGTTLLGADDKAGVAEILAAVQNLRAGQRPHGEVRVIITTDEEIGQGTRGLDVARLGCQYGYTVDGGPLGELEFENFNAADGDVILHGVNVHPGSAKGIMRNALTMAMEFHHLLPPESVPERTSGYEGFLHLHNMEGDVSQARLHYIIRDHDREKFEARKAVLEKAAREIDRRYGSGTVKLTIRDSYYNMKEKIEPCMFLVDQAKSAMLELGIAPKVQPIRGGTDGARLSFEGLPCPNLCAGGENFHGRFEYVPVEDMEKITKLLATILWNIAK